MKRPKRFDSNQKGSSFERDTGERLSLWITGGERKDLFMRAKLSGGAFTQLEAKGGVLNVPGDLIAQHELAFPFLRVCCIECKHRRDIDLLHYLLDPGDRSFLAQTVTQARRQAKLAGLHYIVIAKQNNRPTIMLMGTEAGEAAIAASHSSRRRLHGLVYHVLHGGVTMLRFDQFLSMVRPVDFIAGLEG